MFRSLPKFENDARKVLIRLFCVGFGTLCLGILFNQFQPEGIRWQVLTLSLPSASSDSGWQYASTDSCFFIHLQHTAKFIDVRDSESFTIDHVPGAMSIPFQSLFDDKTMIINLDRTQDVIIYDELRHSKRAKLSARYFFHMGFENVIVMRGGYIEWLDRTFPVETGES